MDLFLDCEWADVLASELVSIALISSDGQKIFYAERDPLPLEPTPWVRTVVYPRLDRGDRSMSDAQMTQGLRDFLASIDNPRICYDFWADRSLCQYVISGLDIPNLPDATSLSIDWQRCGNLQKAIEDWWQRHPENEHKRHHALMDARALRAAYSAQARTSG